MNKSQAGPPHIWWTLRIGEFDLARWSHSSLGYLSPEQFEAARRVGWYVCVSTESGEV